MSQYDHHIFLSYRRSDDEWVRWTRSKLANAIETLLRPGLDDVKIFVDDNVEIGSSWPARLARSLARSRILVPVLSRGYFQSDWCRLELALMHHREISASCRTAHNPYGLIVPVVIDDGTSFPQEVQAWQAEALHSYANPFIRTDSPKYEAFTEVLRTKVCPAIEVALGAAPDFDPAWEELAHEQFINKFQSTVPSQKTVPSLTLGSF